jgi:hypothetical protein
MALEAASRPPLVLPSQILGIAPTPSDSPSFEILVRRFQQALVAIDVEMVKKPTDRHRVVIV